MIVMVLWGLANIGFTMCLSTFFEDPKLAQNISSLMTIPPLIIFFGLVLKGSSIKHWVYPMMLIFPLAPSAAIILQLATRTIGGKVIAIAHVDFISRPVAFAMLVF